MFRCHTRNLLTDIHLLTIYGLCHFFRSSKLFYILILNPGGPIYCLAVLHKGVSIRRTVHFAVNQDQQFTFTKQHNTLGRTASRSGGRSYEIAINISKERSAHSQFTMQSVCVEQHKQYSNINDNAIAEIVASKLEVL